MAQAGCDTHEGSHPDTALAFLILAILLGIGTYQLLHHWHHGPPYTVALFCEGLVLGCMHYGGLNLGTLSESIEMWVNIDPHLLLYVFLPCLLFGDAMGLNWNLIKASFAQCLLLAGPGVVFGTVSTAVVARFILPYGWDWTTSLCFGSILAATDPVAVVGLLKEMGCSGILTMQIAGESLLNDGTAIVLWTLTFNMIKGDSYTPGDIAGFFFWLALGGAIVGALIGTVALRWIVGTSDKLSEHDHILQLSLTLLCAYAAFFIAEHEIHMSGVISCVFAAFCIARAAWPCFCDSKGLTTVWHCVEFFGNTLIFLLAGLIAGEVFMNRRDVLGWADWGWLFVVYISALLIRGLMLVLFYPILRRCGFGTNWKDLTVMWWGGLRGAVGLALAIAMDKEEAIDYATSTRLMFLVGGFASLTLFINATTCGKVVGKLGLTGRHWARTAMVEHLQKTLHIQLRWSYTTASISAKFRNHDQQLVREWIPRLSAGDNQQIPGAGRHAKVVITDKEAATRIQAVRRGTLARKRVEELKKSRAIESGGGQPPPPATEALSTERELFMSMVKAEYWQMISSGVLPPKSSAAVMLLNSIDFAQNFSHLPLCDWADLILQLTPGADCSNDFKAGAARWFRDFFEGQLMSTRFVPCRRGQAVFDLYTFPMFLDAHEATQKLVKQFKVERESAALWAARQVVISESQEECKQVRMFLHQNQIGAPLLNRVRTKQLAFKLLFEMEERVQSWLRLGVLQPKDAEELLEEVRHCHHNVAMHQNSLRNSVHEGHGGESSMDLALTWGGLQKPTIPHITEAGNGHEQLYSTTLKPPESWQRPAVKAAMQIAAKTAADQKAADALKPSMHKLALAATNDLRKGAQAPDADVDLPGAIKQQDHEVPAPPRLEDSNGSCQEPSKVVSERDLQPPAPPAPEPPAPPVIDPPAPPPETDVASLA